MAKIRKNFRMNDDNKRDIEIMEMLNKSYNESELIKNALYFYKKAIDKNVVLEATLSDNDMWDRVFENAYPMGLIKESKEMAKDKLKASIKRNNYKKELLQKKQKEEAKEEIKEDLNIEIDLEVIEEELEDSTREYLSLDWIDEEF